MMSNIPFKTKQINNHIVEVPKLSNQTSPDKIYGYDFCREVYPFYCLIGKSRSGKSSALYTILKHKIDPLMRTNVVIFCSTIHRDPMWEKIQELLTKKNCHITINTHFIEGKTNILRDLLSMMDEDNGESSDEEEEDEQNPIMDRNGKIIRRDEIHTRRPRKPTKKSAKWCFVFDDLPQKSLRDEVLGFTMRSRHYKAMVILSTQWVNNIQPAVRKQITHAILFKSFNEDKLRTIYDDLDVEIDFELFKRIYHFATSQQYNFLQFDVHRDRWIKNFTTEILLN